MKYRSIIVERKEYEMLKNIISMKNHFKDNTSRKSIEILLDELKLAEIRSNKKMPEDVVRFNSTVTIKTPWNVERSYQIVIPTQSDLKRNKISILAPMGLALFGYAEGDEINWQFPMGQNTINILKVEQSIIPLKVERL